MSEQPLDLSKLALDRETPDVASGVPRRRRWVSRYIIPAGILLGFAALLAAAAGDQLFPRKSVTVIPVIVKRGEVQAAGAPLFQAAGWVEPRPTSVSVAALAPGVLESLLVVEGQLVSKDEPIARLLAIDAELAVERARATLAIREGELQRVEAEQVAAATRLAKPVHLKAQLADARSLLAKVKTEHQKLPFLIKAAQANVTYTQSSLDGKRAAESAIAGVIVDQAAKELAAARAELGELQRRGPNLELEISALQDKVNALDEQLELLVEEQRAVKEAEAKVISAAAIRDEAKLGLQQAELTLERTTVRAPMDGRILRLVASPGTRLMGLNHTSVQSSSTVVEMYDPHRLQVRADVRLEDVPMVSRGAPVEIETASFAKVIEGRVLRPTSSANIQKNTLEVKVELIDPPPTLRPEMLVTATFLASPENSTQSDTSTRERILVPQQLVATQDGTLSVWIVSSDGRAIQKRVQTGRPESDGLVEVTAGLVATDKLITSGSGELRSGDAVEVAGEDKSIGMGR